MARAIYYDTETTGINADNHFIIEIAAYDPANDASFVEFVNPGIPIPPEVTAIHHITDDMVADAPPFSEIGKKFVSFCEGDVILIAHNNDAFDIHFLRKEFERNEIEMPSWRFLDTLKWARRYRPDLPRHSLQFLREIYGIPANNAHRALDDVIVLHRVFSQMVDDLSIEDAYQLLNTKRTLVSMPFGKYQGTPLKEVPKDYLSWLKESGAFDKPSNQELKEAIEALNLLA
ncbi:MAG: DUF3820 family protein [Chlamydiales bacterium]